MKKKMHLMVVILMILSLFLAACKGDTATDTKPQDNKNNNEQATENEKGLEGKIRISLQGIAGQSSGQDVWDSVANAYMEKNPGVEVIVDNKPADGYKEWLTAQFATGDVPEVDIVTSNIVPNLIADKKFVDYIPYLEQNNPYTNKAWKDSFDLDSMQVNLDSYKAKGDELSHLNFESVQVMWVYNKDILAEAGYDAPPETFEEMITMFEEIKKLGYSPFTIGGNANSLWSGKAGWAIRIYADQYFRDSINVIHSREGDYTYFEPLDGKWEYDPTNPYNDNHSEVTTNHLRFWKAIAEKQAPYVLTGDDRWKALYENLQTLFSFAPDGYTGMSDEDAYKQFLTGKAATFLGDPSSFWQLPKDFGDSSVTGSDGGVEPFEFGFYNFPTIKDDLVQADVRTIHIPVGFYSVVAKDAKQNALNMDFLQFWTSPEGYGVYLEAVQNSDNKSLTGPPALKDIELPQEMAEAFSQFESIGNMEGLMNASNIMARGLHNYQPNIQDWVVLTQRFFSNEISVDEYIEQSQANIDEDLEDALKEEGLELSDLEHVERKPPERK